MIEFSEVIKQGEGTIPLGVADPSSSGFEAGIGSIGRDTGGRLWKKSGAGNTDWNELSEMNTANVVWVSKSGDDATGVRGRFDRPFLTIQAAYTAASFGDSIVVLPGSYAGNLTVVKQVSFVGLGTDGYPGAALTGNVTIDIDGGLVGFRNIRFSGSLVVIAGDLITLEDCWYSNVVSIDIEGGNIEVRGGTYFSFMENGSVFEILDGFAGSLTLENLNMGSFGVATDGGTTGIDFEGTSTGKITLKNVTIRTAQNGSGVAKSINSGTAITIYAQGGPYSTHAADANVTFAGTSEVVNADF